MMAQRTVKTLIQSIANRFGYCISRSSRLQAASDPFVAMQHLLRGLPNPTIFDVGAHHGHVAKRFRSLFPKSEIYCFEPFPESFRKLSENTNPDLAAHIFNFGFSDHIGSLSFNCNRSPATNSLLHTDKEGSATWGDGLLETERIINAEFETIDSFVAQHNIREINILKLDVQGAEPMVMSGSTMTCSSKMIHIIYSEIIIQPTYEGQKRFDEALAAFYDRGFDLYNFYNMSCTSEGRLRQVDAIFTRQ